MAEVNEESIDRLLLAVSTARQMLEYYQEDVGRDVDNLTGRDKFYALRGSLNKQQDDAVFMVILSMLAYRGGIPDSTDKVIAALAGGEAAESVGGRTYIEYHNQTIHLVRALWAAWEIEDVDTSREEFEKAWHPADGAIQKGAVTLLVKALFDQVGHLHLPDLLEES
jgi:hypothetical protein